jgi:outer membrane cobalamin receptor
MAVFLSLVGSMSGFAQAPPSAGGQSDAFSMDLESLLNTKVTTASRFAEKVSDAPGVMSVVSRDELARFGGATLLQVLQHVAGLNISTTFLADRSLITIRGDQTRANAGHILILINGRPVREVLEGGVSSDIFESFPINTLERIEVVKGPGSVLYGSGAFSGVINLITAKEDGRDFRVSSAGGAAGERSATEDIRFQKGAFRLVEGGQYHNWPEWSITNQSVGVPGTITRQSATLRNNGLGAFLNAEFKGFTFMSAYTAQESSSYVRGIVGDTRLKRGFSDLGYAFRASSKWDMSVNLTYSRSVMDAPDYPNIHRDSYETDLEWTNFITLSPDSRVTFGTVYSHIAGTETYYGGTSNLVDAQGNRNSSGGYVQYERRITDTVKLIGGIQANKVGAIALKTVPRGGLLWNLSGHVTAKVLYGGAFNAPSLDETLLNHPGLKGNPNLVSERVGTLDAQLIYQTNRTQASAGYFGSSQSNLIVQNGSTLPALYYNLTAPFRVQGVEAEGKRYLNRDWFLTASALCERTDGGAAATDLSRSPGLLVKAGVGYLSSGGGTYSVFDGWQGHIAGYGSTLNPPATAFHSISAHARYDLSKKWFPNSDRGFALFLNADDLTNKPVWLPALGSGKPNTVPVTRGRTVLFGIEVWQKHNQ